MTSGRPWWYNENCPDLRVVSLQFQPLISQSILRYLHHLSETISTIKRIYFLPYLLQSLLGETKFIHLINIEHYVCLALLWTPATGHEQNRQNPHPRAVCILAERETDKNQNRQ